MEDPEEDDLVWGYEEYYYNSSKLDLNESNFSWLFRKGLWLGEKAVITGVVISSAPLILPSLVIVSALGFAVSVPAGVVLASYTCTEKLMNKLLPMPAFSCIISEEEGDEIGRFEVARNDQEVQDACEKYNLKELPKRDTAMVSEAAVCESENAGKVVVLEDIKKINDEDVSRDKSMGKRNRKKSKSCHEISHRIGERESKKDTVKHNDAKSKVENLVPVVEMKSSLPRHTGNGVLDKRLDEVTVGVGMDSAKIPASGVHPGEKILWDKIDALRLIVGYKATRKPSLSEELRALYAFTGIEPTSSFEKTGDVRRTEEEKLRFLMYIIGVK